MQLNGDYIDRLTAVKQVLDDLLVGARIVWA